jgi:BCD family chlorophyll transporter-like MFS transporter
LWMGSLLMFGGLAIMPFALLLLSSPPEGAVWVGRIGAGLAFVLVGAGIQVTQTAGLALASDVAPVPKRPRVVQVVQGCAVLVVVLNVVALWKQEARQTRRGAREPDGFSRNWRRLMAMPKMRRFLWTVGLGTAAFSMQDIVLEPFGGEVLGLDVGLTSALTALSAGGSLLAFMVSARWVARGLDAARLAALGALLGLPAFALVIFSAPLESALMFRAGAALIGFAGGLFSVGMLLVAMDLPERELTGLVLGAWGAVQATATGAAMALGGTLRDVVAALAQSGWLGQPLNTPATAYSVVFHLEIYLLFVVLIALGPLVRRRSARAVPAPSLGLAELPG